MTNLTKKDKHKRYVACIKEKINKLSIEKRGIEVQLRDLHQKLQDNENYTPEEE